MDPSQSVPALPFPVVAVGASAGGLAAFELFFSGVRKLKNPPMAFVLIQHLDPVHHSLLPELVRGFTDLPVFEALHGMPVQSSTVYTIPPGKLLSIAGGILRLEDQPVPRNQLYPIDRFFVSLAADQGDRAVAVILSGTGSDGTQGLRAIHRRGGLVLAQSLEAPGFEGMPRSAFETGEVDDLLPAERMARRIRTHFQKRTGSPVPAPAGPWDEEDLRRIFTLLEANTAHDFSKYKPSTIQRRIERRMAVHRLELLTEYRILLEQKPEEVTALFNDLLIGVTSFFRDPEVFQILADRVVPGILRDRPAEVPVRVWSAGCSTGEEAYSLAILLREAMEALGVERKVQVFATDIDKKAIDQARSGTYPAGALGDFSPDRLKRFFTGDKGRESFRIHKTIRDLVVFSDHDLIKDPPFFKLDLLVCRNLLIYLSLELQKKIVPMFHYALNPGGILVLGTSETIGEFGHLFEALDRSGKVYVRREALSTYPRTGHRPTLFSKLLPVAAGDHPDPAAPPKTSLRTLTEQTILRVQDMAAALVNRQGDVQYLHGRTGYFLEPPPGPAGVSNILKMAKDGLKHPLTSALHQAGVRSQEIHVRHLPLTWKNQTVLIHLGVHPVDRTGAEPGAEPLFLVLMEEEPAPDPAAPWPLASGPTGDARYEALRRELAAKEAYLQNATEEMEASNEELRSSNEELQSVNEELQSSNEELETSKEELQSVNEELTTVNTELQSKVAELTTANNDMNNLLSATGIATVFLDLRMNILRFTPEATRVINLIASDLGRPVSHLASNLMDYLDLEKDTQRVLDTLVPQEREVRTRQGTWYRLKVQPYRTIENVIEGAVLSFIDITEIVLHRSNLERSNALLQSAALVRDSRDPIIVRDLGGRILAWNPGAAARYGWSEEEALAMSLEDLGPGEKPGLPADRTYRTVRRTKDGGLLEIWAVSTPLINKNGEIYAISTLEHLP